MAAIRRANVLALAVVLGACSNALKPGRCDRDSDCAGGEICNLDPTPQGNGRCVATGTADGGIDAQLNCSSCSGGTPVCIAGACVECASNADCGSDPTKPICDTATHICEACSSDDQCVAKLGPNPGVCMAHEDGHCATDLEAVYVQNDTATCVSAYTSQGGTASMPYCSMDPVDLALTGARTLAVVRGTVNAGTWTFQRAAGTPEVSLVGQQRAIVAGGSQSAFILQNGSVYIRDVDLSLSASVGVIANGGTLRLENDTVDSCQAGGILLDGASFDLRNVSVTNNGPGTIGTTTWGGILINAPSSSGPENLTSITIQNNKGPGLSCVSSVEATAVFAAGNSSVDISPSCNITPCSTLGPNCGASP
jgi:hypothetical protein